MKTRYKIPLIAGLVFVAIFVLVPVTYAPLICDDRILSLDDCGNYLEEKYTKLPIMKHFMEIYPEASGLGSSFQWYQVQTVTAGAILEDKNYASLEFHLSNSSTIYRCEKHTKEEYRLLSIVVNPTIDDLNENNCTILNQNIQVDDFSLYESEHLGFQIEHPREFEVNEILNDTSYEIRDFKTKEILVGVSDKVEFSSDLSKFYKSPDVPFSYNIRIHENVSTVEEIRDMVENNPPFPLETRHLGENEAWGGILENQSNFHDGYSIFTINQNKSYSIFFAYPKDQTEKYMSIIDHILNSFKFRN